MANSQDKILAIVSVALLVLSMIVFSYVKSSEDEEESEPKDVLPEPTST